MARLERTDGISREGRGLLSSGSMPRSRAIRAALESTCERSAEQQGKLSRAASSFIGRSDEGSRTHSRMLGVQIRSPLEGNPACCADERRRVSGALGDPLVTIRGRTRAGPRPLWRAPRRPSRAPARALATRPGRSREQPSALVRGAASSRVHKVRLRLAHTILPIFLQIDLLAALTGVRRRREARCLAPAARSTDTNNQERQVDNG
jgi:hypothetical protein